MIHDRDRIATAVHESGHWIVAETLGLPVLQATIQPRGTVLGEVIAVFRPDDDRRLPFALAGRIANYIADGISWHDAFRLRLIAGLELPDLDENTFTDAELLVAAATAARILRERWEDVRDAVAVLLVDGRVPQGFEEVTA